jgi:hypothetical protein
MVEGCIVYELFYYANDYIKQIDDTEVGFAWYRHQYEDKREGVLLQTNT